MGYRGSGRKESYPDYEELYFQCVNDFNYLHAEYKKLKDELPSLIAQLIADYLSEEYGLDVNEADIEDIVEEAIREIVRD